MFRKIAAASALSLGVIGGTVLMSGIASANAHYEFLGTRASEQACSQEGIAGMESGKWKLWKCDGADLWVSYTG